MIWTMTEPRAQDGIDHLQRAALELIAAARAFLDVAEDVVDDRDRFTEAAGTVSGPRRLGDGGRPSAAGRRMVRETTARPTTPPSPTAPWASILDPDVHDRATMRR